MVSMYKSNETGLIDYSYITAYTDTNTNRPTHKPQHELSQGFNFILLHSNLIFLISISYNLYYKIMCLLFNTNAPRLFLLFLSVRRWRDVA